MTNFCSQIVDSFGSAWNPTGWVLFTLWFLLPFLPPIEPMALKALLWLVLGGLLTVWWLIDAIDQSIPWWQMALVILLLGLSFVPIGCYALILRISAWVIYQLRFREA
ncbi:MAG: hypothetical protein SNJ72_06470 [Fimbriimonadales bacterium]